MLNLLKSKCLLIRTYYEQFLLDDSYFAFLIDQSNAFEKFIRRHKKIAKGKNEAYLNFIKFTRKLAQGQFYNEDIRGLKEQLEREPAITFKTWLLEKMQ